MAEFYRVLLGFIGFTLRYWVLPSFPGFSWVSLCLYYIELFVFFLDLKFGITVFARVLLGFIEFHRVLMSLTWIYWVILG